MRLLRSVSLVVLFTLLVSLVPSRTPRVVAAQPFIGPLPVTAGSRATVPAASPRVPQDFVPAPLRDTAAVLAHPSRQVTQQTATSCQNTALDVYYLLDLSGSMNENYDGAYSKLEAATVAISQTNALLTSLPSESRAGLVTFLGATTPRGSPPKYSVSINLSAGLDLPNIMNTVLPNLVAQGGTPTTHAIRAAADQLANDTASNHTPVLIVLSDGVPSISYQGEDLRGYGFLDADVQAVSVTNSSGGFRSIADVRADGGYYSQYDLNAGQALATVMEAIDEVHTRVPQMVVHAVAIQGTADLNPSILQYVAAHGGGTFSSPSTLAQLQDALRAAVCAPPPSKTNDCGCQDQGGGPQTPLPVATQAQVGQPINTRTGNLWTTARDLQVASAGPDLTWGRTYNSQSTDFISGTLGAGWQSPFDTHLRFSNNPGGEDDTVIVVSTHGNYRRFHDAGNGTYDAALGVYGTLVQTGSTYVYTLRSQEQFVFDLSGRLVSQTDAQGGQLNPELHRRAPPDDHRCGGPGPRADSDL